LDCNPKVTETYLKLLAGCDQDKTAKVNTKAAELKAQGKKTERALADALEYYKLAGAVNA
jgi:hypothetical protein